MKHDKSLRTNSAKSRNNASQSFHSSLPNEIENYYPKERRYRSALVGEIKLDRSVLRLSTPVIDDLAPRTPKVRSNIIVETNPQVLEFLKLASVPFKKKKDYPYCIMRSINDFHQLSLPNEKITELSSIIPKTPYSSSKSMRFIKLCKFGNTEKVEELLMAEPNLVYTIDICQMTGLHWSALRNFPKIASLLIEKHCLIDAIDCNHRTPLYLASSKGHYEVARLLLIHRADPKLQSSSKKTPLKVSKNPKITEMLKKITLHYYFSKTLSQESRGTYWQNHAIPYINSFK